MQNWTWGRSAVNIHHFSISRTTYQLKNCLRIRALFCNGVVIGLIPATKILVFRDIKSKFRFFSHKPNHWLPFLLLVAFCPAGLRSQKAIVIDPAEIIKYSLDWLSPGKETLTAPIEVSVYSLNCGECVEELKAIADGQSEAPSHFILTTFQKKDRDLVLPLMQLGFEQTDSIKRRSSLLEILKIYGEAPDYYGNNGKEWTNLLESFRRKNVAEEEKKLAEAFAINVIDSQTRILALLDKLATPNSIPLDQRTFASQTEKDSNRYRALIASHSLGWLKPALQYSEDVEEILKRARTIDPTRPLNVDEWKDLKEWAFSGVYWLWGGRLDKNVLENVVNWQAPFHLLPSNAERRDRHRRWFDETIKKAEARPLSALEAFGFTDIDSLISSAWNAAVADVQQQLVFCSYIGTLAVEGTE